MNPLVTKAFDMAIHGKFKNETRWISHEEFDRLKTTDPYVAFCFSFGNDLKSYAYGRDVEPYKKALHYLIVFQDESLMKKKPCSCLQSFLNLYFFGKDLKLLNNYF